MLAISIPFKRPWLYSRAGLQNSFRKSAFHVIFLRSLSFFSSDLELSFWKSARCNEIWIFFSFWQNMLLGWLKKQQILWGTENRCLKVQDLKKKNLTCFDVIWPFYLQFVLSKKSWRDCRKNIFWPKSDSLPHSNTGCGVFKRG